MTRQYIANRRRAPSEFANTRVSVETSEPPLALSRQLLGEHLTQLSFAERQAIAQCLISHVIVTGEAVDIHFVLPFASPPQAARRLPKAPEGTPGHFYRLRLAHFDGIEVMATMGR